MRERERLGSAMVEEPVELSPLLEHDEPGFLHRLVRRVRTESRIRRAALFKTLFRLGPETRILDLGGANGAYAHALLADTRVPATNVCVADIEKAGVEAAMRTFGYGGVTLAGDGPLPFADCAFDVVLCSSVLEHVTVPAAEIWSERSTRAFRRRAIDAQTRFAAEIRRVARGYFVQVPYRWFPIETHSWLPFLSYLPRPVQCRIIATANRFWIKKTVPDFYLPTAAEMAGYFPGSRLFRERLGKLTKSLIAVRTI
jgi:SAM-dependent methyltransferase